MDGINYTFETQDADWWCVARDNHGRWIASVMGGKRDELTKLTNSHDYCIPESFENCRKQVEEIIRKEKLSGLETIS
jgi:hypothetical protein